MKQRTIYKLISLSLFIGVLFFPESLWARCSIYTPKLTNSYGFYWGKITFKDGSATQAGDEVRAYSDAVGVVGGCVGFCKVEKSAYYGSMAVYGDDPTTSERDGIQEGDIIYFTVCHDGKEYRCNETSSWKASNANNQMELNLTVSAELKDQDGEKEFTQEDALCAFKTYLRICPASCSGCDRESYDVNKDRMCTPFDALCIYRNSKGLPSCLD